jgi:hypothetical protein
MVVYAIVMSSNEPKPNNILQDVNLVLRASNCIVSRSPPHDRPGGFHNFTLSGPVASRFSSRIGVTVLAAQVIITYSNVSINDEFSNSGKQMERPRAKRLKHVDTER